ncbi:hypothetical protein M1N16_06445 [Nitrospinaceae bacterium]|nr:hypothetical protein [Nitrospinaceae bacterium]
MSDPFFAGLGAAGMFLVIYAGVLAFFLQFYVMGIYNQTKAANINLKILVGLFQTHEDRLELRKQDPNSIFYKKN